MPEIRIGEIISAEQIDIGEGRSLVVVCKATGDIERFLEAFRNSTLTVYLTEDDPLCGIQGQPAVCYPEILTCELKRGHKAAYHRAGGRRWLGAFLPADRA